MRSMTNTEYTKAVNLRDGDTIARLDISDLNGTTWAYLTPRKTLEQRAAAGDVWTIKLDTLTHVMKNMRTLTVDTEIGLVELSTRQGVMVIR